MVNEYYREENEMKKKTLDDKWVFQLIDMMIGPHMAVMYVRDAKKADELISILAKAVRSLHDEEDFENTNEWVKAASDRVWNLYNTFMTAMLMDRYDNGMPEPPKIVLVKGNGKLN